MPKIDKKTGIITTSDNYQIYFHGNEVEVKKDSEKLSLAYERLVGGSVVIYKEKNIDDSNHLLKVLDNTLSVMKLSYEII